jgi:riboflavin kinase/FMN adenylyltransferase
MKIIGAARELQRDGRGVCLAIGVFDGVHLGHQQIIRQTLKDASRQGALALVLTFDRHPNAVVAPERVPSLIHTLPQKLRAVAALGADAALVIPFDVAFSRQSGREFILYLARALAPLHSICVGADFVFGHRRSGQVALLEALGAELQFAVHGLAAVTLHGQVVSSTRIRDFIQAGQLTAAGEMLGRPYALAGRVVTGDGLGRQLGFPTANLESTGLCLPPHGVYAGRTWVQEQAYRVALNIGSRPTLGSPAPVLRVEAHLLDFNGDLYGQELEIEIGDRLREEKKFDSTAGLSAQIARDLAAVRAKVSLRAGQTVD